MHKQLVLLFLLPFIASSLQAQVRTTAENEIHTYVFPIRPKQRNWLSSSYGELRGTHLHTALDVRTEQRIGLPVHATAVGYVSRIKIQRLGYGKVLYLQHPNGYTSVYAHLSAFSKKIEQWTLDQQYAQRSYTLDMYPKPWQFRVDAGEVVAFSGNTGGSTGPHLHFELRDAKQRTLDPARVCNFEELYDVTPPSITRVAFVSMDINARINGQFGRFEVATVQEKGGYRLAMPLHLEGCIGIELMAFERDTGPRKLGYGPPIVRMKLDDEVRFSQDINVLDFAMQRQVSLHMNMEEQVVRGRKFSKLYIARGNTLPIYHTVVDGGRLCFDTGAKQAVLRVEVQDSFGNQRVLRATLNSRKQVAFPAGFKTDEVYGYTLQGHTLLFHTRVYTPAPILTLSFAAVPTPTTLSPTYTYAGHHVYLWDLRNGVPTAASYVVTLADKQPFFHALSLDLQACIPSGVPYRFSNKDMRIDFTAGSLYDTLYLRFRKEDNYMHNSEIFHINNVGHPLRQRLSFVLKPNNDYLRSKTSAYLVEKNKLVFLRSSWQEDYSSLPQRPASVQKKQEISFTSDTFGSFVLLTDTIPPRVIRVHKHSNRRFQFFVEDTSSGISRWEATLNDKWLLMEYLPKQDLLETRPLPDQHLYGTLRLQLADRQHNAKTYIYHLKP